MIQGSSAFAPARTGARAGQTRRERRPDSQRAKRDSGLLGAHGGSRARLAIDGRCMNVSTPWQPDSWRTFEAQQQPSWPDQEALRQAHKTLSIYPPLVFAGEVRALSDYLGRACTGEAFLLQGGDCAESFGDFTTDAIRDKLKVLLQMAVILTFGTMRPVIKVGRIAGQFAKPRSSPTETKNGKELPSFRGDSVNDLDFTEEGRQPDPQRLIRAYFQSAATLNLLRSLTNGGFADLHKVHNWNLDFVKASPQGQRYTEMADKISEALRFMGVVGINVRNSPILGEVEYFTSHEALILEFEEAMTRFEEDGFYDCSAHMLWIGERTRQVDGAHVEFLRGVKNPIGCKLGASATPDDVLRLCDRINPDNIPGRLTFITRFGHERVEKGLIPLLQAAQREGKQVVWSCDPMHGNTYTSSAGLKTRDFKHILNEVKHFFAAHKAVGTIPGGIHLELTGSKVTECVGGSLAVREEELPDRYETTCDPRLNVYQSLDMAFLIAEELNR